MLQSMGSQRVAYDLGTEQEPQQTHIRSKDKQNESEKIEGGISGGISS